LIERVAQRVADLALRDPRVLGVEVQVQKPGALRFARCSEVEIMRTRDQVRGGRDE
jgi:dihydroneopterin aldolase/D-erythro-7,8-dihydroneopterin triphosphate epimerase